MDLPHPDSEELIELVKGREVREAYRFLYHRRNDPPTMSEWRVHAAQVLGKANEQTDRRLRELRNWFIVKTIRRKGSPPVYHLEGRNPVEADGQTISSRLEAEVYSLMAPRCAMCGKGPQDGVKLQIDHKIPRSWGGQTVLENLQPLCTFHNHGKQAFVASYDEFAPSIRIAMRGETVWHRIGMALEAFAERGKHIPTEVIAVVAGEGYGGDPTRRLRDLRTPLGWRVKAHMRKEGNRRRTEYELISSRPWPAEGPAEAVLRYERGRKKRKQERGDTPGQHGQDA